MVSRLLPTITVILLLLYTAQAQDDADCATLVAEWSKNITTVPTEVMANSGKFLNDLGDFNDCLYKKDNYDFITMSVLNRIASSYQHVGFCLPKTCTPSVLTQDFAAQIQNNLNKAYQEAINTTYSPFVKLSFMDPVQASPKWQTSNFLVLALVMSLITVGVVGSVMSCVSKSQAKSVKILKAFSIYDNMGKIMSFGKAQSQNLIFINGMRVISIIWIIFGHDEWFRFMNMKNWMSSLDILATPGLVTLIPAAYFAVDTFFWIGGFLLTISLCQKMLNMKKFSIPFFLGLILHRFIRIWPTYMVAILVFWKIAPLLLTGPIWPLFQTVANSCNNGGILWNMFFIDNFEDHGPSGMDYCFGWGWYLAVDFQCFLITPLIFYLYSKNKKIGLGFSILIFLASVLTAFIMIMVNDWRYPIPNPKFPPQPDFMDKFYYKPYIRISAYIMGIWSGFFYLEWKSGNERVKAIVDRVVNSPGIRAAFYIIGVGLINFIIWIIIPFQTGESTWSTFSQAVYNSLNRVVFLMGIILVTFPAMFGCKNDPCHKFLGSSFFSPLAKVSFCVYLVHFIVIMMGTFSSRMDIYWQPITTIYVVASDVVYSVLLATCLSVLVEAPIMGLEKLLLRGGGGERKKEKTQESQKIEFQQDNTLNTRLIKTQVLNEQL